MKYANRVIQILVILVGALLIIESVVLFMKASPLSTIDLGGIKSRTVMIAFIQLMVLSAIATFLVLLKMRFGKLFTNDRKKIADYAIIAIGIITALEGLIVVSISPGIIVRPSGLDATVTFLVIGVQMLVFGLLLMVLSIIQGLETRNPRTIFSQLAVALLLLLIPAAFIL